MVRATLIYPDLYIGEIQALITVRQYANSCINIFEAARCSMNRKSQTFTNIYIFRIQMWFFFFKLTIAQFTYQYVCLYFQ